eukprot:scaffold138322_cov30-Prasinocladus_malaysianus.AAC.1
MGELWVEIARISKVMAEAAAQPINIYRRDYSQIKIPKAAQTIHSRCGALAIPAVALYFPAVRTYRHDRDTAWSTRASCIRTRGSTARRPPSPASERWMLLYGLRAQREGGRGSHATADSRKEGWCRSEHTVWPNFCPSA